MRVLTVRQPWAGSIIHHGKDVENRSRNVAGSYRGPVAIHVSLRHDYVAQNGPHADVLGFINQHHTYGWGHVIGVVELVGSHESEDCYGADLRRLADLARHDYEAFKAVPDSGAGGLVGRVRFCSRWAMDEHHHLVLANPRAIDPISAKGRLGLWRPDDALAAQIAESLA